MDLDECAHDHPRRRDLADSARRRRTDAPGPESRRLHEHPRQRGRVDGRVGDDHLLGGRGVPAAPAVRARRRARVRRRRPTSGAGSPTTDAGPSRGTRHVLGRRPDERASARARRDDDRRPPRAAQPRGAARLRRADALDAAAREDGARGDRRRSTARQRARLRQRRRDDLDRRSARGLDDGDHRQGAGRQGRGVGRGPHPRRLHLRARQHEPHPRVPARRPGELALLAGRDRLRGRAGLLGSRLGRAVPLPRRLSPDSARHPSAPAPRASGASTAAPRTGHTLPGRLPPRRGAPRTTRCSSRPTRSSPRTTSCSSCATTTKARRTT